VNSCSAANGRPYQRVSLRPDQRLLWQAPEFLLAASRRVWR
jgi:hypothetical protein